MENEKDDVLQTGRHGSVFGIDPTLNNLDKRTVFADALETTIEDGAVGALKKQNSKLLNAVNDLVNAGRTPKQIDSFIEGRFGLKKGHPVRDLCYLAALSLARKVKP